MTKILIVLIVALSGILITYNIVRDYAPKPKIHEPTPITTVVEQAPTVTDSTTWYIDKFLFTYTKDSVYVYEGNKCLCRTKR